MIILIRHASPIIDNSCCSRKNAKARMFKYNETDQLRYDEIDPFIPELYDLVLRKKNVVIYTSTLPRSINTARHIFKELNINLNTNSTFSEFDLDILNLPICLPIMKWFFLSRIAWFFGIRGDAISFYEEKKRSILATNILESSHAQNTDVMLVGHAFINRFIKMNLKQRKWVLMKRKKRGCFEIQYLRKLSK